VAESPDFRKYLEAALVLGQVTRARAEEMLHEMAGAGELQREQIEQWMDELVDRGHQAATGLLALVRNQVDTLLGTKGAVSLEDLVRQAGDLLTRAADSARSSAGGTGAQPAGGRPAGAPTEAVAESPEEQDRATPVRPVEPPTGTDS